MNEYKSYYDLKFPLVHTSLCVLRSQVNLVDCITVFCYKLIHVMNLMKKEETSKSFVITPMPEYSFPNQILFPVVRTSLS